MFSFEAAPLTDKRPGVRFFSGLWKRRELWQNIDKMTLSHLNENYSHLFVDSSRRTAILKLVSK